METTETYEEGIGEKDNDIQSVRDVPCINASQSIELDRTINHTTLTSQNSTVVRRKDSQSDIMKKTKPRVRSSSVPSDTEISSSPADNMIDGNALADALVPSTTTAEGVHEKSSPKVSEAPDTLQELLDSRDSAPVFTDDTQDSTTNNMMQSLNHAEASFTSVLGANDESFRILPAMTELIEYVEDVSKLQLESSIYEEAMSLLADVSGDVGSEYPADAMTKVSMVGRTDIASTLQPHSSISNSARIISEQTLGSISETPPFMREGGLPLDTMPTFEEPHNHCIPYDDTSRSPLPPKNSIAGQSADRVDNILPRNSSSVSYSSDDFSLMRSRLSFNANKSVFLKYNKRSLSPPLSPLIPSSSLSIHHDDESVGAEDSDSLLLSFPPFIPRLSDATHDVTENTISMLQKRLKSQCEISMVEWGMVSYSSIASSSSRRSLSSKRRGNGKTMPFSRIRSFRNSMPLRLEQQRIGYSMSEDALYTGPLDTGPSTDGQSETMSTDVQSSSPDLLHQRSDISFRLSASSPNLQVLDKLTNSETRAGQIPVTPSSVSSQMLDRVFLSPMFQLGHSSGKRSVSLCDESLDERDDIAKLSFNLPRQDEALLEEALMAFSSVTKLDFLDVLFPGKRITEMNSNIDIVWHQLIARWKHKNLTVPLRHIKLNSDNEGSSRRGSSFESHSRRKSKDVLIRGLLSANSPSSAGDGFMSLSSLARCECVNETSSKNMLRHHIKILNPSSQDLIDKAHAHMKRFSSLIEDVAFGIMQSTTHSERGWYSAEIKSVQAIERKMNQKYAGDVLQVKDVLRARLIFPDEGSLIEGLLLLNRQTKSSSFSIVRIKNCLSIIDLLGLASVAPLPSGYMHVLVNIRLRDGFLAEIQCNLASVFDILGEDGYRLHQELSQRTHEFAKAADTLVDIIVSRKSRLSVVAYSDDKAFDPSNDHSNAYLDTQQTHMADEDRLPSTANSSSGFSCHLAPAGNLSDDIALVLALVHHGSRVIASNPRDIPSFACLEGLLLYLLDDARLTILLSSNPSLHLQREVIIDYAVACLLRCLAISNQSNSIGMTGWLEYGSNSTLKRAEDYFPPTLHDLACCYACRGRWNGTEHILQAASIWCEQTLHECHPVMIVTYLDLAASELALEKFDLAESVFSSICRRLSSHLSCLENECMHILNVQVSDAQLIDPVFRLENGSVPLSNMISYAKHLQLLLNRRMVSILGPNHDMVICHHKMLGDVFSLLANCYACAESLHTSDCGQYQACTFWIEARKHYVDAFRASTVVSCSEASLCSTALGLARCLHELGNSEKAIKLLSTVVCDEVDVDSSSSIESLPTRSDLQPSATASVAKAACYWLMAALSVHTSSYRLEGWLHAVECLRASSQLYQRALTEIPLSDSAMRASCTSQLLIVEDEARLLFTLRSGPPSTL